MPQDIERKHFSKFNKEQLELVDVCRKTPSGHAYGQGSPGSGKTFVICHLIKARLETAADLKEHVQILVTAPSNAGLNNVARGFVKKFPEVDVVRPYPCHLEEAVSFTAVKKTAKGEAHGSSHQTPLDPGFLDELAVALAETSTINVIGIRSVYTRSSNAQRMRLND